MKGLRIFLLALLPVAVAVTVFVTDQSQKHPDAAKPPSVYSTVPPNAKKCPVPDTHKHYLGVVVYKPWQTTLPQFIKQGGVSPKIVEYYVGFGASFDMARLAQIYQSGFPIIQVDPNTASLHGIADGRYDKFLKEQAKAVAAFRCPIAISFGHEMNGNWYVWGVGHVKPAVFVAAWRHIYNVFAAAGAHNVIWTWTINRVSPFVPANIKQWWPGQKYVDWVGIDAYYRKPKQTFGDVFNDSLQKVRGLTHDPVLAAETSVSRDGPQAANIKNLFQGARHAGLFAVVWFNINAKQHWNLAGRSPSVLAAFRAAAKAFQG